MKTAQKKLRRTCPKKKQKTKITPSKLGELFQTRSKALGSLFGFGVGVFVALSAVHLKSGIA